MTMTPEERAAYGRGYRAIKARHWRHVAKLIEIARGYREAGAAVNRRCDTCVHWRRGGETIRWGYCDGDFHWGADAHLQNKNRGIVTGQDFYCANWRAWP